MNTPEEHPFAQYVRILGKGKQGSRSLSFDEARDAMSMILRNDVEDLQLGAFLMLMRVKEESPEELAGFITAVREQLSIPLGIQADLDWSSYAGKRRQLPWYLLAMFTLADHGHRVFLHGSGGHTAGRQYTEQFLHALDIPPCDSWEDVSRSLDHRQFAFMPLSVLCPPVQRMMSFRQYLGLRSPIHTMVRLLNPLAAPYSIHSIFHPAYAARHQHAALRLQQPHSAVFKGEGGEVERRPEATCKVAFVHNGELSEQQWPKLLEGKQETETELSTDTLRAVWRGEHQHRYGEQAIVGTVAITLCLLEKAPSPEAALKLAHEYWNGRRRDRL